MDNNTDFSLVQSRHANKEVYLDDYEYEMYRQDQEMQMFNDIRNCIYNMFYNGCFLYYMNFDNFVDFINGISYTDQNNYQQLECNYYTRHLSRQNRLEYYIHAHKDIYLQVCSILNIHPTSWRMKRFVYDFSFKSCICLNLTSSTPEYKLDYEYDYYT